MFGLNQEIKLFNAEKIIWPCIYILCLIPLIVGCIMVFQFPELYFVLLSSGYGLAVLSGFVFLVTAQYIMMKKIGNTFFDNLEECDQIDAENRPSKKLNPEYLKLSIKVAIVHGFFGQTATWIIGFGPIIIDLQTKL